MRTTLSLDDDVAAQLEVLRARRDRPFKQLVNEALRVGLATMGQPRPRERRAGFTSPVDLGRPLIPIDDVSEALALAEGEDHG